MYVMAPKRDRGSNLQYELTFTKEDLVGIDIPYNDALVLMMNIYNYDVTRVLVDLGNSSEKPVTKIYSKKECSNN